CPTRTTGMPARAAPSAATDRSDWVRRAGAAPPGLLPPRRNPRPRRQRAWPRVQTRAASTQPDAVSLPARAALPREPQTRRLALVKSAQAFAVWGGHAERPRAPRPG